MSAKTASLEAEALVFAREMVAWHRNNRIPLLGIDVALLDGNETKKFSVEVLKGQALHNPTVADLAAAGWRIGDRAVREVIAEVLERGNRLPTHLARYNKAARRQLRGRERATNVFRDIAITVIVGQIIDRFGLQPTGRSRHKRSASSIAAEALGDARINVECKAVEEVWRRYNRIWKPD